LHLKGDVLEDGPPRQGHPEVLDVEDGRRTQSFSVERWRATASVMARVSASIQRW
jgi:hypothetical protein